jgi:peptide alpha-N-acetyltransferase
MSYHLLGDFDTANSILETFRSSQNVENYDYKHSELLLYQNQVIQESGNLEKALKHLRDHQSQILDKLVAKEMMGELCLKLRHFDEAEPIYLDLIKRNPDNSKYFYKYLEAKQITDPKEVVEFYKAVQVSLSSISFWLKFQLLVICRSIILTRFV